MLERRDGTRHEAAPDAADHPAGGLLGLVLLATARSRAGGRRPGRGGAGER
jgi:hypothetical protein